MANANLLGNMINIHPFEDGNGRICHLILAHVLTQTKCRLFPVILSSFYGRGRRYYLMLYTMIVRYTTGIILSKMQRC